MTYPSLNEGSVVLRLEFSIADAVHQRGLLPVIRAAVVAWWNRPRSPARNPAYLPARLREDIGLPPEISRSDWLTVPPTLIPDPLKRWGM